MGRIFAYRLIVIPALCILTGGGCAILGDGNKPDPDSATVDTGTPPTVTPDTPERLSPPPTASATADAERQTAATTDGISDAPTEAESNPCTDSVEEASNWLDRSQKQVYETVCGTVAWFDGFFGDRRYDAASANTFGRVGLSGFWDERDGFDPKLRFRAKYALPALRDRANIIVGRGDEKDFIEERETPSDSIPSNFNRVEDDSFLIGLGYQRDTGLRRGLDFSAGIKVRAPPEPYLKARYRRAWELSNSTLLHLRPVVYWKSEEGVGATLATDIDQLLSDRMMLRWSNSGNISQDNEVEGVAWVSYLSLYSALANRRALSYHTFIKGETGADVGLQNYGVEVRYRQRVLRDWLFFEVVNSVTWPRFTLDERREMNLGIGAGFEMYFGPVPETQLR